VPPGTYTASFGSNPFQHVTGLDFGTLKLASISGTVRGHQLQDGQLDPQATGLSGWTVQLWDGSQLVATTTTALDGFIDSQTGSVLGHGPGPRGEVFFIIEVQIDACQCFRSWLLQPLRPWRRRRRGRLPRPDG
jgi:hypothetical protein